MKKTTIKALRLEVDLYKYIEKLMKRNRTTFSHEIRQMILENMRKEKKKND